MRIVSKGAASLNKTRRIESELTHTAGESFGTVPEGYVFTEEVEATEDAWGCSKQAVEEDSLLRGVRRDTRPGKFCTLQRCTLTPCYTFPLHSLHILQFPGVVYLYMCCYTGPSNRDKVKLVEIKLVFEREYS